MATPTDMPWWQLTTTPTRGFVRGGLLLTLATLTWVFAAQEGDISVLRAVLGVVLTVLGLLQVGSAALVLARRPSLSRRSPGGS